MEPSEDEAKLTRQVAVTERVRGLMLGLALGDALGGGPAPSSGPLPCGVGTQLAAVTAESLIRARVRFAHRGIVHAPSVLANGYRRWAAAQGLLPPDTVTLDGWVCQLPVMSERRGSAPATVTALAGGQLGTMKAPVGTSAGAHALVRAVPLAARALGGSVESAARLAAESAALTHGHPHAWANAAAAGVFAGTVLAAAGQGEHAGAEQAHAAMSSWVLAHHPDDADPALQAHLAAADTPASPRGLARACQGRTAADVLAGAVYCLLSYPDPDQVGEAITLATSAPDGRSTAAATGALAGCVHGAGALPVPLVSRLEAGWVMEVLARDLVTEMLHTPGGGEYRPASDPAWTTRYPGH